MEDRENILEGAAEDAEDDVEGHMRRLESTSEPEREGDDEPDVEAHGCRY